MISIRRFAFSALLAVTTISLAPTIASAQEPARGKFTLTHAVNFGKAKVPAGDYQFTFDHNGISSVIVLSKVSGAPAGYMVLVPTIEETNASSVNRLMLETTSDGSYVSAMQLPEFGMTLHFNVPRNAAEKVIAKAATTAAASGQ